MRIGILGGSFDPIHRGHLNMAVQAHREYGLDEIWLIPAGHSPNKRESDMTSAEERLAMTALAIGAPADRAQWENAEDLSGLVETANPKTSLHAPQYAVLSPPGRIYPYMRVSAVEVDDDGISYTYRTLEKLCGEFPQHDFFFLLGADSLDYFDRWVHPEIICAHAVLLVVNRDEFSEVDLQRKISTIKSLFFADIRIVHCSKMDISSHEIREALQEGRDCAEVLPKEVYRYLYNRRQ